MCGWSIPVSENSVTVVDLDVTGADTQVRADAVRDWLLESGIIVPNPDYDELWQPSAYAAGPSAANAFPGYEGDFAHLGVLANSGVDINTDRQIYHPVANEERPTCPACGTKLDDAASANIIDDWFEKAEPIVTCSNCGASSRIGDWPGEWTYHVGDVAVTFNNWPPLSDAFIEQVGRRLGNRWRVVKQHI
jgi:hypothetical protein